MILLLCKTWNSNTSVYCTFRLPLWPQASADSLHSVSPPWHCTLLLFFPSFVPSPFLLLLLLLWLAMTLSLSSSAAAQWQHARPNETVITILLSLTWLERAARRRARAPCARLLTHSAAAVQDSVADRHHSALCHPALRNLLRLH